MTHAFFTPGRRRVTITVALAGSAALVAAGLGTASYAGAGAGAAARPGSGATADHRAGSTVSGFTDSRVRPGATAPTGRAATAFRRAAGGQTVLDIDPATGTVRMLTRLDGFLTGKSGKPARRIALGYVRKHHAALGLSRSDTKTFHLARDYRDIAGQHHLFFVQTIKGKKVISNGLTASVNRKGHLLTVGGSPVSRSALGRFTLPAAPDLATPSQALAAARAGQDVAPNADLGSDSAEQGLFVTRDGVHLAWLTVVMSASRPSLSVVDAAHGGTLLRRPLTNDESGADRPAGSTGTAYRFFPKAPRGGRQINTGFTRKGWLSPGATILKGNNSHTYSDVDDNQKSSASEEVHPRHGHAWDYPLKPFHLKFAKSFCGKPWPCSWNPNKPFSWRTNRAQNATQVFFYVNNWHDHLQRGPIGFTEAAGNFQRHNHGKAGKAGDPVTTQTDDGANTDHGLPDSGHIDNANMATPPDGHSPRMQMYLQHAPHTSYPAGDPFSPTNVGDEADTVYHEYTHGLSNRLNVDVQGASTLGGVQGGAMGEAWSDWYAMDYLVAQHLQKDKRGKVDVRLFVYDGEGVNSDRTEPIDCPVGSKAKLCNGGLTGKRGGYTYAQYGTVVGSPEVHSDGEIWAQTLWSLRYKLGSKRTESLVTRAMELAPYDPSFLDMRNAILVADTSLYRGHDRSAIWKVFASRGMGFLAGSFGGEDSAPGASFVRPPKHLQLGSISGTVTDRDSGQPVPGVPVALAFQGAGIANPTAVTDAAGHYTISGVPQGRYTKLVAQAPGYQPARQSVRVTSAGVADVSVRRDWAALSGGAKVSAFTSVNFSSSGCGPRKAIDLSPATGWVMNNAAGKNTDPTGTFVPKSITVDLQHPVNITGFGVDPSTNCGLGASAATGGYQIETSPDGVTWTPAAAGTFTAADGGHLNDVAPTAGTAGVRFVRFTILSNQTPDFKKNCPSGAYTGCQYSVLTELEVFGLGS